MTFHLLEETASMTEQKQPAIQRFMAPNGRVDYRDLKEMAEEYNEQRFAQMLGCYCLVGKQVLPGEINDDPDNPHATKLYSRSGDGSRSNGPRDFDLTKVIFPLAVGSKSEDGTVFTIGQDDENDLVISEYSISHKHLQIRRDDDGLYFAKDLGSKNSTIIGKEMCETGKEVEITCEEHIQLGRYLFQFLSPGMLYARLKGFDMQEGIMELINNLGKADYKALKEIATWRGEEIFVQLVRYPALVGVGLFKGYLVDADDGDDEDDDDTKVFLDEDKDNSRAVTMKYLARNIFPIVPIKTDARTKKFLTIGRSPSNDLCMDDNSISRSHSQIRTAGEGHYLYKDYGSSNGSRINGEQIGEEETPLNEGDKVKIGRYLFIFVFPSTLYKMLRKKGR